MDISISSNNVNITGNIKTINDFQSIKSSIDSLISQHKSVTINVIDSISMTSSVIGYINKLILKDHIDISMNIGNKQLIALLNDLNLSSLFKVKKA